MNRTTLLLLIFLAAVPLGALSAQDVASFPPPRPPLIATVPESAAWVLAISDTKESVPPSSHPKTPAASDANTPMLKEMRITKTGVIKRDISSFSNGNTVETWYAGSVLITADMGGQPTVVDYKAIERRFGNGLNATESDGFTGLCWIDLKNYREVVIHQGQPCYYYRDTTSSQGFSAREAWINTQTGLPVAYTTDDGMLYTYRFIEPPGAPLSLPPTYQAALTKYEKDLDKIQRLNEAAADLHRP